MQSNIYRFKVTAEDDAAANRAAQALVDTLSEREGVEEAQRVKDDQSTMDLGMIVTAVMTSGATLAVAQGIAAWLKGRRSVSLEIEQVKGGESIKTVVRNIDPGTAARISETILK
jgi:hypothetical protein